MGKVAFVFPGQASQYPGMGRELAEKYAVARVVFEEADQALGFSISKMCFEGSEDELKQTANTQPASESARGAIPGVSRVVLAGACKRAGQHEVCAPANLNSHEQTVISGNA